MPGRSIAAGTLLLLLLASPVITSVAAAGCHDQASRCSSATFLKGTITTSRSLVLSEDDGSDASSTTIPRRALVETGKPRPSVWVLGVPTRQQGSVRRELEAHNGALLHTLPDHWLVTATEHAIKQLLKAYHDVSAAVFPEEYKVSPAVDKMIDAVKALISNGNRYPEVEDLPEELRTFAHRKLDQEGNRGKEPLMVEVVGLVPESTRQAIEDLSKVLQLEMLMTMGTRLNGKMGCNININPGPHAVKIKACLQNIEDVVTALAAQGEVTWVQLDPWYRPHDLMATAGVQGSSLIQSGYPAPDVELGIAAPYYPLWRAGLSGRNQVVGVIDSGLDMDSCYVWDPAYPNYSNDSSQGTVFAIAQVPPFNQISEAVMFYTVDGHRKVQMYNFQQDEIDSKGGHGTHVITSMIGSPFSDTPDRPLPRQDFAQGAAYDGKVALIDVGQTCEDGDDCGIYVDALQLGNMLTTLKLAQGYISVNSWGTEQFSNSDNACYTLNLFAYGEQNTLQIFPSGNVNPSSDDPSSRLQSGTVNNPGICSNVLTVGATENWVPDGVSEAVIEMANINVDFDLQLQHFIGPNQLGVTTFTADGEIRTVRLQPYNGYLSAMLPVANKTLEVIVADPEDACTKLTNNKPSRSVFVLVRRSRQSECTVDQSVTNVWDFGRSAGVIISDTQGIQTLTDVSYNNFPTVYAGGETASWIETRYFNGTTVNLSWEAPPSSDKPPYENVARFSGFGSSRAFNPDRSDKAARMKPDLVAPGYILAGYSDGIYTAQKDQCQAFTLAGTSMAAAQVGAAAMIARQYFLEGYYPVGLPTTRAIHFPSGPLIKAVLVAGAVAMNGVSRYNDDNLKNPPSQFQGFGRLDLTSALPLQGGANGYKMQVIDRASFNATGASATYMIDVGFLDESKPLAVVLTFFDYPAFPGAPNLAVNDLDLQIRGPMEASKPQTYFPNGLDKPDPVNNVEKIYLKKPSKGTYRITVTAANISPLSPVQQYSLVVLGAVSNTIYDDFNPAVNPQPNEVVGTPPDGGGGGGGGGFISPPPPPFDFFTPSPPPPFFFGTPLVPLGR